MAMRHDEAFKFLFDLPEMCADPLRVAADLSKRKGDALCAVDLREGALADGRRPYLVAPTEFQLGDAAGMPDRMREYALRQFAVAPGGVCAAP